MNTLSNKEKEVIIQLCKHEKEVLEKIFMEGGLSKESLDSIDNIITNDEFLDTLLDSYNYFKSLETDVSLVFEADEYDGNLIYKIVKYYAEYFCKDTESIKACESLMERLNEFADDEEDEAEETEEEVSTLEELLSEGENKNVEFKPCLLYSFVKRKGSIDVIYKVAKAICAFLNTSGGQIIIGVNDSGKVQGLDFDYSLFEGDILKQRDRFNISFDNLLKHFFDRSVHALINTSIVETSGKDICVITVMSSDQGPVFLKNRIMNEETKKYDIVKKEFFIRGEASTLQITDIEEIVKYVLNRWGS